MIVSVSLFLVVSFTQPGIAEGDLCNELRRPQKQVRVLKEKVTFLRREREGTSVPSLLEPAWRVEGKCRRMVVMAKK